MELGHSGNLSPTTGASPGQFRSDPRASLACRLAVTGAAIRVRLRSRWYLQPIRAVIAASLGCLWVVLCFGLAAQLAALGAPKVAAVDVLDLGLVVVPVAGIVVWVVGWGFDGVLWRATRRIKQTSLWWRRANAVTITAVPLAWMVSLVVDPLRAHGLGPRLAVGAITEWICLGVLASTRQIRRSVRAELRRLDRLKGDGYARCDPLQAVAAMGWAAILRSPAASTEGLIATVTLTCGAMAAGPSTPGLLLAALPMVSAAAVAFVWSKAPSRQNQADRDQVPDAVRRGAAQRGDPVACEPRTRNIFSSHAQLCLDKRFIRVHPSHGLPMAGNHTKSEVVTISSYQA